MSAAGMSEALFSYLSALTGGVAWYPLRVPDGALPAGGGGVVGTYQRISAPRTSTHSGGVDLTMRRYQLTVYSDRYTAGLAVARDLVAALNGVRVDMDGWDVSATIADDAEDVDPEPRGLYRQRVDVMLSSKAP